MCRAGERHSEFRFTLRDGKRHKRASPPSPLSLPRLLNGRSLFFSLPLPLTLPSSLVSAIRLNARHHRSSPRRRRWLPVRSGLIPFSPGSPSPFSPSYRASLRATRRWSRTRARYDYEENGRARRGGSPGVIFAMQIYGSKEMRAQHDEPVDTTQEENSLSRFDWRRVPRAAKGT